MCQTASFSRRAAASDPDRLLALSASAHPSGNRTGAFPVTGSIGSGTLTERRSPLFGSVLCAAESGGEEGSLRFHGNRNT